MYPILVEIPSPWGDIPIYSYGVMLGTSLIVAWYFIMKVGARLEGLHRELMANTFLVTAITAIVASRLLYIFTNLDDFDTFAKWFEFRQGGLVAYGGFIGGVGGSWFYLSRKKVPFGAWADLVAPTLGSGLFFTRIGCYLYGCDFGKPLAPDAPAWLRGWGTFPRWSFDASSFACDASVNGSPAFNHHTRTLDLATDAAYSLPVHPTQLYESAVGFVLFGVSVLVLKKRQYRGQVLLAFFALYGVWRFFVEYVRDDPERGAAFGFSTSQLISLAMIPLCLLLHVILLKRKRERGEPAIPAHARDGASLDAEDEAAGKKSSKAVASAKSSTVRKKGKKAVRRSPKRSDDESPAREGVTDEPASDGDGAAPALDEKKKRRKRKKKRG